MSNNFLGSTVSLSDLATETTLKKVQEILESGNGSGGQPPSENVNAVITDVMLNNAQSDALEVSVTNFDELDNQPVSATILNVTDFDNQPVNATIVNVNDFDGQTVNAEITNFDELKNLEVDSTIVNVDDFNNLPIDVVRIGNLPIDVNSGTTTNATQRIVLSDTQPTINTVIEDIGSNQTVALQTTNNAIHNIEDDVQQSDSGVPMLGYNISTTKYQVPLTTGTGELFSHVTNYNELIPYMFGIINPYQAVNANISRSVIQCYDRQLVISPNWQILGSSNPNVIPGAAITPYTTVNISSTSTEDSITGNGARAIQIVYRMANDEINSETVNLSGVIPTQWTPIGQVSRILFVNVVNVGNLNQNDGDIVFVVVSGQIELLSMVPAGANRSQFGLNYVPKNQITYLKNLSIQCATVANDVAEFRIRIKPSDTIIWFTLYEHRFDGNSASIENIELGMMPLIPDQFISTSTNAGWDIVIEGRAQQNGSDVSMGAQLNYFYQPNSFNVFQNLDNVENLRNLFEIS